MLMRMMGSLYTGVEWISAADLVRDSSRTGQIKTAFIDTTGNVKISFDILCHYNLKTQK